MKKGDSMQDVLMNIMEIRRKQTDEIDKLNDLKDTMRNNMESLESDIVSTFDEIYDGNSKTSLEFRDIGNVGMCFCIVVKRGTIPVYYVFKYLEECGFKMENMMIRFENFSYIICFPVVDLV